MMDESGSRMDTEIGQGWRWNVCSIRTAGGDGMEMGPGSG